MTKEKGNKKLMSGLIALGVLIWALAGYRLFGSFFGGDEGRIVQREESRVDTNSGLEEVVPDTYELRLDYEDPFLGDAPSTERASPRSFSREGNNSGKNSGRRREKEKEKDKEEVTKDTVQKIDWPEVHYGGVIRNRSKQEKVALLVVDKKERLMSEGDSLRGVELRGIWEDSVRIAFQGEGRTFSKKRMVYEGMEE